MANKERRGHEVVTDFADAEVRAKSGQGLAACLREWESVPSDVSVAPPPWGRLQRRTNCLGYPPFDIFDHWLMDFASISARQLERTDWRNYRRMLLVHVPDCPLKCWYCFNDAWRDRIGIKVRKRAASTLVNGFATYRGHFKGRDGNEVNVLRLSGGEPFTAPDLVKDIATEFSKRFNTKENENKAFLWVDTNLVPVINGKHKVKAAVKALASLGNQAAVHACIHGADKASFNRNTLSDCDPATFVPEAWSVLKELNIYWRINPAGLNPEEAEKLFFLLANLHDYAPLRTYLGPIELQYKGSIDRMLRVQQNGEARFFEYTRPLGLREPRLPELRPWNAVIYRWNELLERHYGFGYGVAPRFADIKPVHRNCRNRPARKPASEPTQGWKDIVLITKGWEKEVYARKLLEILALPRGAITEIEFENKWIEPTFLAHLFAVPKAYEDKRVLFLASAKGRPPKSMPLRWGTIQSASTTDGRNEHHGTSFMVKVGDYATDFERRLVAPRRDGSLHEALTTYLGESNLPFAGPMSYFCRFVGLPLRESRDQDKHDADADFITTVLEICGAEPPLAKNDVYYRLFFLHETGQSNKTGNETKEQQGEGGRGAQQDIIDREGCVTVVEGQSLNARIQCCNPNIASEGFVDLDAAEIEISSTSPQDVMIAPSKVVLSKFGTFPVQFQFPRRGEFEGHLLIRQIQREAHIAELRIPFRVAIDTSKE